MSAASFGSITISLSFQAKRSFCRSAGVARLPGAFFPVLHFFLNAFCCVGLFFIPLFYHQCYNWARGNLMDIWVLILGVVLGATAILASVVLLITRLLRASGKAYMDSIDKM